MKKLFLLLIMAFSLANCWAEDLYAEIQFEKTAINFGKFPSSQPEQKCSFVFKNIGTAPLIINQAFASCGCTVPTFTKAPIKPGETGVIEVTYNGQDRMPGAFKKTITIRSNSAAKKDIVRLTIEGEMTE